MAARQTALIHNKIEISENITAGDADLIYIDQKMNTKAYRNMKEKQHD